MDISQSTVVFPRNWFLYIKSENFWYLYFSRMFEFSLKVLFPCDYLIGLFWTLTNIYDMELFWLENGISVGSISRIGIISIITNVQSIRNIIGREE